MSCDGRSAARPALLMLTEIFRRMRSAGSLNWRGDIGAIRPETPLRTLGIDSIEWVSLLLEMEATLGQRIYDSELAEVSTLGQLLDLLGRKSGEVAQ